MQEIWRHVPLEATHNIDGYEVSNNCILRKDGVIIKPNKGSYGPKGGRYKITTISGKTVYIHRLMYFAFNPDATNKGRVILRNIVDPQIDQNGFFKLNLEDLIFQSFKESNYKSVILDGNYNHPIYGQYTVSGWYPVKCFIKNTLVDFDRYELQLTTSSEFPCKIRNKTNNRVLNYSYTCDMMMTLTKDKKPLKLMLTHIMLSTIFPSISRNETVDHIDHNHKNGLIYNLEWVSSSENSKRNNINKKEIIKVQNSILNDTYLENEIWIKYQNIEVSDKGRIKNKNGIGYGTPLRGKKYRSIVLTIDNKKQRMYIHHIVWIAFNTDIPKEFEILHDDSAPLDNGMYRNWLVDLKLGTRKENILEYHREKRNKLLKI